MTVYAIYHPNGFAKIGKSDKPAKRLSEIQTGCPYQLELYAVLVTNDDAEEIEETIHKALQKYHVRGEWFDVSKSIIDAVFSVELESEDNDAFHTRKPRLGRAHT